MDEKVTNNNDGKYYCTRYKREVELWYGHCLGCSLFPFNRGECPSRKPLNNNNKKEK